MYPARQRWTLPPREGERAGAALPDAGPLAAAGVADGAPLVLKDLGPQVSYAAVFFWEYAGPLFIYPLFFLLPSLLYPGFAGAKALGAHAFAQKGALAYWSLHYAKRLYETAFVHRFSHGTMPARNLLRNCAYYWAFAAYVSYYVNHPLYTAPPAGRSAVLFAVGLLAQAANLRCHALLARLRAPGAKGYVIPRGFLFDYITCPNYTAEFLVWFCFATATQAAPAALFAAAGFYQMAAWAAQKHRRLVKAFDGREGRERYPRRWVMLPPVF